jgi:RNA polymerase sigma-70 factor (ECF subfamily)
MDEAELIGRLRLGEDQAYEELLERYLPQVYRLAHGITQDPMEAQDVTQEVFLSVFKKVGEFHGKSSLLTWIYRITVNASLDRVRSRQRRRESVPIEAYLPSFTPEGRHAQEIVDWSEAPLDRLLNREARKKIQEALEGLHEDLRVVLVMKDVEGFPLKEICDILELSLPAVKSRLHRARLVLRGALSSYFQEEAGSKGNEGSR